MTRTHTHKLQTLSHTHTHTPTRTHTHAHAHAAPNDGRHDALIASTVRSTIVDTVHALGAAVMGEMYNLQHATITKMLDGGRNTDMYDNTPGFPGELHDMVASRNASGVKRQSLAADSSLLLCFG